MDESKVAHFFGPPCTFRVTRIPILNSLWHQNQLKQELVEVLVQQKHEQKALGVQTVAVWPSGGVADDSVRRHGFKSRW